MNKKTKDNIANIIQQHSELADESLTQFIVECYRCYPKIEWRGQYPSDMSEVLIEVLTDSIGSAQDIVDIITEDEGYFKFANLDKFNKDMANGDDTYKIICNTFIHDLSRRYKVEPHLDFSIDGYSTYPAYIDAFTLNSGLAMKLKNGLDGYTGVVVSRSVYPQASESAMSQPHMVFVAMNVDKLSKAELFGYGSNVDCTLTTDIGTRYYDDPGLIYVPVKKFFDKVVKRNFGDYGIVSEFTVLPKQVITKYGLPTLAKF